MHAWSWCEIIPVDRLIHGAVLVSDKNHADDYFVVDTLDADMFLQVKTL